MSADSDGWYDRNAVDIPAEQGTWDDRNFINMESYYTAWSRFSTIY